MRSGRSCRLTLIARLPTLSRPRLYRSRSAPGLMLPSPRGAIVRLPPHACPPLSSARPFLLLIPQLMSSFVRFCSVSPRGKYLAHHLLWPIGAIASSAPRHLSARYSSSAASTHSKLYATNTRRNLSPYPSTRPAIC